MVTREQSRKNVISNCISKAIPPQMKILIMVIPILMQFCLKLEHFKPHKAACHQMTCDVINDIMSIYD